MLIQVKHRKQTVNVYVEQLDGDIFDNFNREDVNYIRCKLTQCVTVLIEKYCNIYGERTKANVVEGKNEGIRRG